MCTPKQRMLNAYRGEFSDRYPVAPEFWYYYPARIMGLDMIQFQREVPHWKGLQVCFKEFGAEGWGAAFPDVISPDTSSSSSLVRISDDRYRETLRRTHRGKEFLSTRIYDRNEPYWEEKLPVERPKDLESYLDMVLSPRNAYDFTAANSARAAVGEDYLLELWIGLPFFDFIAEPMGFEKAILLFLSEPQDVLLRYRARYIEREREMIRRACLETSFESFVIGCSASCNSLLGPVLWRAWDKPCIASLAEEIHAHGRLLHVHFHGRSMETIADFAEMGIDCVCPFERPPGGDVDGEEGLSKARRLLSDRVTFNGNVHTVDTLIRGTARDVRREVRELKRAFSGSPRLIIGTGDQVGRETPEENIRAMIEEAKSDT